MRNLRYDTQKDSNSTILVNLIQVFWSLDRALSGRTVDTCGPCKTWRQLQTASDHRPCACRWVGNATSPVSICSVGIERIDRRVIFLVVEMCFHERVAPHLAELHEVVRGNTSDSDEETGDVDGSERVFENDVGCSDGDDFFENAADAECDDRGSLQQSKLRCRHKKGKDTREKKDSHAEGSALHFE